MKGSKLNLQVGSLKIKWEGKRPIDGLKPVGSKYPSPAQAWRYRVQSTDNWSLVLAYLVFEGRRDKREIHTLECSDGTPEYIRMLKNRRRMSVSFDTDGGKDWVELSHAQPKNPGCPTSEWPPTLKQATKDQLDKDAGFRLGSRIEHLGGSFGLRKDILGESKTRNNYYCAVFPHDDHRIPILCYIVTRVLALIRAHQHS